MRHILIILGSFFLVGSVHSQVIENPNPVVEGITIYENVYIRNGEEQASGTVEEKIVKQGDNTLFIYTQTIPAGDFIDSVIIDSQTRLPIRYVSFPIFRTILK